ncbi:MAG: response regulator [Deltaproteobacteria bacterium]|nr:MAG: response regulator [Deltaproteobacteria bacterium]
MKNKKVLIIDDDPDIIEWTSYNLARKGYEISSAFSGPQALWEVVDQKKPDVILLDIMIPSPNGYEICEFLKTSDEYKKIPVIMISAKTTEEDRRRGFLCGADAYLPKPFSIEKLTSFVDQFAH